MLKNPSKPVHKLVMLGLGEAGKSSIKSLIFEGKTARDIHASDYTATKNYIRTSNSFAGNMFSVFDCGGQEVFLTKYVGKLSEFIFSNVQVLIWVVDVLNFEGVSKSKYYFDLAMSRLKQYSPKATVYCLFHKVDLLAPDKKSEVIDTLKKYFVPSESYEMNYYATTIFNHSLFTAFSDIMGSLIKESETSRSLKEFLHQFMQENAELLSGVFLYTDTGLLISGEGTMVENGLSPVNGSSPANTWITEAANMQRALGAERVLKGVFETEKALHVFQQIEGKFLCMVKAKKDVPIQYVLMKVDELSNSVKNMIVVAH